MGCVLYTEPTWQGRCCNWRKVGQIENMWDLRGLEVDQSSAGLGFQTVRQLAAKGAKVFVAARSESRATEAINRLVDENPAISKHNLAYLPLDLSDQAQVANAARALLTKTDRLDILGNYTTADNRSTEHYR
jgi:enoyl-[acyl-carrier-protein] reductase (NADH)